MEDFVSLIESAIGGTSPVTAEDRIAVAKENSWDTRIEAMSTLIEDGIEKRRSRQESWDTRLRRVYRGGRRRALQTILPFVAAYLLLFRTSFIWVVAEPLRVVEDPRPADAIVVFAGGAGESGTAGGGYQERVRSAVDLFRAGMAPLVVFSSGYLFDFREAEVMRDLAVSQGIPPESIKLELRASSTYDNVVFTAEIVRALGADEVLLVSSPFHMRRALLTWQKQVPDIKAISTPVSRSQFYTHGRGANFRQIRGIVWEYAAIATYWLRGWI